MRSRLGQARSGFTLIELLVVIAIIAILIGLLVPAVQKVRESAARAQCQNNMKQFALACHTYHDTYKKLPAGCSQPVNGGWGFSWIARILPYVEQNAVYMRFNFNNSVWNDGNNSNVANGVSPSIFFCPSSSMRPGTNPGDMAAGNAVYPTTSYVGIAGSFPDLGGQNRYITGNAGVVSGGGLLFPNSGIKLHTIRDGSSNTMMIGEQSDFILGPGGVQNDWHASLPHSAFMGYDDTRQPTNFNGGDNRAFNTTTVRYTINDRQNLNSGNAGWTDNTGGTGVGYNMGVNSPLISPHTGGINAGFGDGSVRFLVDSLPLSVVQQLATRDDGIPLPPLD